MNGAPHSWMALLDSEVISYGLQFTSTYRCCNVAIADGIVQYGDTAEVMHHRICDGSPRTCAILRNGEHVHKPKNVVQCAPLGAPHAYAAMQMSDE